MGSHEIIIPRGAAQPVRTIYSPATQPLMESLGKTETRRASHVEPTEELSPEARDWLWDNHDKPLPGTTNEIHAQVYPSGKWWADCLPVGGPVLGPFDDRDTALAEETKWLKAHNIPTCRPCADRGTCRVQIEPEMGPVLTNQDLIDNDTA